MTTSQLRNSVNRSPLRRGFLLISLSLLLTCLGLRRWRKRWVPTRTAISRVPIMAKGLGCWSAAPAVSGIPALGSRRLTTSLPATKIRRPVFEPCLTIPTAASTPLRAFYSLFSNTSWIFQQRHWRLFARQQHNRQSTTRPTVIQRSISTPKAMPTRPLVLLRSIKTPPATPTRPSAVSALNSNTTGDGNVAFGSQALFSNTTGLFNNAFGVQALYNNTSAAATRPSVIPRSLATPPAATTSH